LGKCAGDLLKISAMFMSSSGTVTSDDGSAKVTNENGDIEFYL
jgi:hypothetical protein